MKPAVLSSSVQLVAWTLTAFALIENVYSNNGNWSSIIGTHYHKVGAWLLGSQALGCLDLLLALVGASPSPILGLLVQLLARDIVLFVVEYTPEVQASVAVLCFSIAWVITELVRLPWLLCKTTSGVAPAWLTWLRYSCPLVLYVLGGVGEGWAMYLASSFNSQANIFGTHFRLSPVVTYVYLPLFIPGFLFLYYGAISRSPCFAPSTHVRKKTT